MYSGGLISSGHYAFLLIYVKLRIVIRTGRFPLNPPRVDEGQSNKESYT